jgi:hypothetical protein
LAISWAVSRADFIDKFSLVAATQRPGKGQKLIMRGGSVNSWPWDETG